MGPTDPYHRRRFFDQKAAADHLSSKVENTGIGGQLMWIPDFIPSAFPDGVWERCKKNKEKKLTSVSFAFTHTYTHVKTNIFPFFPQAYMENFEKCAKTQTQRYAI